MPISNVAFALVSLAIFGVLIFRVVKYGGVRGMLYGSRIVRTIGEIQLEPRAGSTGVLRVHVLADGRVVVERVSRSRLSSTLNGVPMDRASVAKLIDVLRRV